MKAFKALRLVLIISLLLFIASPASADVLLPEGLIAIEDQAFVGAAWLSGRCAIPEGVQTIGAEAFSGCTRLTELSIPASVTRIGSRAFAGCSGLTGTLTLSSDVSVAEDAFSDCPNLTIVIEYAPEELYTWIAADSKATITGYTGSESDIVIPETLNSLPVTAIGDSAFASNTTLTSVTIPQGVTSIGSNAFSGCTGLKSISIPDSIAAVGSGAFSGCSSLTGTLTFPENAQVAQDAFTGCDNLTVELPGTAANPSDLFEWSVSGSSITITDYIGTDTAVIIPASIDGLPVTAIGSYAFASTRKLTSITLPGTITTIGEKAFSYCTGLKSIVMPATISSIERYAFYYCTSLTGSISLIDTDVASSAFTGCRALVLCYTGNGDGTLTLGATYGSRSAVDVPAMCCGRRITAIGREAFAFCTSLKTITFAQGLTTISQSAFYYCTSLREVILPESLTDIGSSAFRYCTNLRSVSFPEGIRSVGTMAFANCGNLAGTLYLVDAEVGFGAFSSGSIEVYVFSSTTSGALTLESVRSTSVSVTIPGGVKSCPVTGMTAGAFSGCSNVQTISLPAGFTEICEDAFRQCETLVSISIPVSVSVIGPAAFADCTSLTSITIPANVKSIGTSAFAGCTSLESLIISSSSTQICQLAFSQCTALTNVTLPAGFTNIGNHAFASTPWLTAQVASLTSSIIAGCSSDYQKALALHDWLIYNTAYDMTATYYGAEGILFHGCGVCSAYTNTYRMMLSSAGITNQTVSGTATDKGGTNGSHAWNLILLDGDWYHVDTTWDDPLPGGNERHLYFCMSDAQLSTDHQWDRDAYPAATGTKYGAAAQ